MARARVEFFFDCSSPWTYLAFNNIQPLAAQRGVDIEWRPILVGGVFNSINPTVYEFRARPVPAKDRYIGKDLADWARLAGLSIRWRPTVFPVNSVKAMRGCLVAAQSGLLVPYARGAFEAYWRDDLDIAAEPVLEEICLRVGLDVTAHRTGIADPAIKKLLRDNTEELVRRGGFGTPTIFVDGGDMYFGNDRLCLVSAALRR